MKYNNGIRIIKEIFDSYDEYEVLPKDSTQLILRLLDDLKFDRKIKESTINHFKDVFPELFEKQ